MTTHRWLLMIALTGCASSAVPGVRFANAPPVQIVDDRQDVPGKPAPRKSVLSLYHFDGIFYRAFARTLELPRGVRAQGVNALDEVPDSTWFTNRIGVRDITPDELVKGPASVGSPEPHKPWTIIAGKTLGVAVGFTIKDARGEIWLLKLETIGHAERETAAGVIINRLMWAVGYNVPEEHVVYFRTDELTLAPDAVSKDGFGVKIPLDKRALDEKLVQAETDPQRRYRGNASRIVEGVVVGGHAAEGTRPDDPNDRIPHQLRRDLRGAYAIYAWLDNADVKEDNSLDAWIKDPKDPNRHYIKHYQIDFGKGLGFLATSGKSLRRSHEFAVDHRAFFTQLFTLGLNVRAWERRSVVPTMRGVGQYTPRYDVDRWKAYSPAYLPFRNADRFDKFWASKILIRFTREQLRAVVESVRLSDPRSVEYLVDTLVARQRWTAAHWFQRVSPLADFTIETVDGPALCFNDLVVVHKLEPQATTRYAVAAYDKRGAQLGSKLEVRQAARTCTGPLAIPQTDDGYTMVRIDTHRPDSSTGIVVHIARDPSTKAPRVIGLWRL